MSENQKLFALFIDGDNVNSKKIQEILDKINTLGSLLYKSVYYNISSMEHWIPIISKYSLDSEFVPNNTKNKNSVDIALVVDAMKLLYEDPEISGFCIVASDADYTALAQEIKKKKKYVLGIGEDKTPDAFRNACTEFIDLGELGSNRPPAKEFPDNIEEASPPVQRVSDTDFLKLFGAAYKQALKKGVEDEHGRVTLRELKEAIHEMHPELSSEFQQMPKFVSKAKRLAEAYPNRIELEENPDSKPIFHYIRVKAKSNGSKLGRFRRAYSYVADNLNRADNERWVTLSDIGQVLRELYPDHDYLAYRGEKHAQMKKVVQKMEEDYPDIIELDLSQHGKIRIKK